ncbi:hypothetical protein VT84_23960 [Gemmata sp. SH-PL17]|uniref:hypothetical protein n=1 Tax=Gemmata sp. SH-PL17 TaxID=1630693 RepID=UPI0004B2C909|nr:hypothetical protein [Gemmata sp. SH-PL17]AMV27477.1 hypothetical protein VT84_23960 [Gemmata sp. SH-PL17]
MRRLRLDALQLHSDRLHLCGQLFDGIAYEVRADRVVANFRVTGGVRKGPAEAWAARRPRVLFQSLAFPSGEEAPEPTEHATLNGTPFHGVSYSFDPATGSLLQELDLHPTRPGPSREWFPSGRPKAEIDRARPDGTTESEAWYENGQRETYESLDLDAGYTPDGRLRTLRVECDCADGDLDRLSFSADSVLDLAGPGVTDAVVERLAGLSHVEDLELRRTNVSATGLMRFSACLGLTRFRVRRNAQFGEVDVRNVLARLPNCQWDGRLN